MSGRKKARGVASRSSRRPRRAGGVLILSAVACVSACRFSYEVTPSDEPSASLGDHSESGNAGSLTTSGGNGGQLETGGSFSGGASMGGTAETGGTGGSTETLFPEWWDTNFRTRVRVDINNSSLTTTLTNFPIALRLVGGAYEALKAEDMGDALRFVDDGHETELPYEIETGATLEDSTIWIRIPQIQASPTAESFWLYYDNPDAGPGEQPPLVWTNGFLRVYHLNGDFKDSTNGMNDAAGNNTTFDAGQANQGILLNGSTSSVDAQSTAFDNLFQGGGTVSVWHRPTSSGNSVYPRLFDKSLDKIALDGWALQLEDNPPSFNYRLEVDFSTTPGVWETTEAENYGGFRSTTLSFDSLDANTLPSIYVDGTARTVVELLAPEGTPQDDSASDLYFGNFPDETRAFDGGFDEIRLSNVIRSAEWIATEHLCLSAMGCASVSSTVDTLD